MSPEGIQFSKLMFKADHLKKPHKLDGHFETFIKWDFGYFKSQSFHYLHFGYKC